MTEEIRTVIATIQPTVSAEGVDRGVAEVTAKLKLLERAADGTLKSVERLGNARVAGEAQQRAAEKTLRQYNDLARDTLKYEKALEQLQRVMEAMNMDQQIATLDGINARYKRIPQAVRLLRSDLAALEQGAKSQAAAMQAGAMVAQRAVEALTESVKKEKQALDQANAAAEAASRIKRVAPSFDTANQAENFRALGAALKQYQTNVEGTVSKLDRFGTAMATIKGQKDLLNQAFRNGTLGLDTYTRSMYSAVAAEKALIAEQARRASQAGNLTNLKFDGKFASTLAASTAANWQQQLQGLANYQRELRETERAARIAKLAPDLDMTKFNQSLAASMGNLRKLLAEADAAKAQANFSNFMGVRGPPDAASRASRQAGLDLAFGADKDAEALQRLIGVSNAAALAQQKLEQQIALLNRALGAGKISAEQYSTSMAGLRSSQAMASQGMVQLSGAMAGLETRTAGLYQRNVILRASFINAFQMIAAGQPIMSSLFIQATQSIGAFNGLSMKLLGVATAAAIVVAALAGVTAAVAGIGDKARMAEGRLKSLLDNALAARQVFDNLQVLGRTTGVSATESTGVFSRLMIGGEQLGATTGQMERLLETFQKLGLLSSATTQELVSGMRQFTQAMGKGKLDGDELRSVLENLPEVMRLISRETGHSIEVLREMGAQGKLTSQIIFDAMISGSTETDRRFSQLPLTMNLAFNRVKVAMEAILIELDRMTRASERLAVVLAGVAGKLQEFALWLKSINQPGNAVVQLEVNTSQLSRAETEVARLERRMTEVNSRIAFSRNNSQSIFGPSNTWALEDRSNIARQLEAARAEVNRLKERDRELRPAADVQRGARIQEEADAADAAAHSASLRRVATEAAARREENDKVLRGLRSRAQIEQEYERERSQVEAERRQVATTNLVLAERIRMVEGSTVDNAIQRRQLQEQLNAGLEREALLAGGLEGLELRRRRALEGLNREGANAERRAQREVAQLQRAVEQVSRRGENQGTSDEVKAYGALGLALEAYTARVPRAQQSVELLTRAQEAQAIVLGNLTSAHEQEMRQLTDTTRDLETNNRIRELEAEGSRSAKLEIDQLTTARQVEQIEMRRAAATRQIGIDLLAAEGRAAEILRGQLTDLNAQYDRQVAAARAPTNQRSYQDGLQAQQRALDNAVRESGDFFFNYFTGKSQNIGNVLRDSLMRGISDALAEEFIRPLLQPLIASIVGQNGLGGMLSSALAGGGGTGGGGFGGLAGLTSFLPAGGVGGLSTLASTPLWGGNVAGPAFNGIAASGAPTLGALAGGIGGGFALGSMIGSFTAGDSAARQTNAQIGAGGGAVAGAIIGSIIPGIGTVIGGLIGGALGGGGGGLIGPGAKTNAYGFNIGTENGQFALSPTMGSTGNGNGGAEAYAAAAQAFAAANTLLASAGISVGGGATIAAGGNVSPNHRANADGTLQDFQFTSSDARMNTALQRTTFTSMQELATTVQEVQGLIFALDRIATPVSDFEKSIESAVAPLNEMILVAQRLGFGEAELVAERERVRLELVKLRDTEVAQGRAEIEERRLRALGLDSLAAMTQQQREANVEIDEYQKKLESMGLTSAQAAVHAEALTQALQAEIEASRIALSQSKRQALTQLDQRSTRSYATLSGNANDVLRADLFDLNEGFRLEALELEKSLKGLGFSATETAQRVAQLTRAQERERKSVEQEFARQKQAIQRSLEERLIAATTNADDPEVALAALERAQIIEREEAVRLGLANIALLEEVHLAEKLRREQDFANQSAEVLKGLGGNIRNYINSLRTGAGANASPLDRLSESQRLFDQDMTLATGGDRDALGRITQSADALLEAGKAVFASTTGFQDIRQKVLAGLESLPAVKSYDQLIYEELKKLGGVIEAEVVLAATLTLESEITAALERIEVGSASLQAKLAAQEVLSKIHGVLSEILLTDTATNKVKLAATAALSTIVGAVSDIAVASGVTEAARTQATALLQSITGKVEEIAVSEASELAKISAIQALASITGDVRSIGLNPTVTDLIKQQAIERLATITGKVSEIGMDGSVPEKVRLAAVAALKDLSGAVTKITVAASVTNETRLAANAALEDIVGKISLINMVPSVPGIVLEKANAVLGGIVGNVQSIALASDVTDETKALAFAQLSTIVGKVASITLDPFHAENVKMEANAALAKMVGVVEAITLNRALVVAERDKANVVFATMYGVVDKILTPGDRTAAAKATLLAALGNMTTTLTTVVNSTAAAETKLQLLADFGNIQSLLKLATDTSSIPEDQLKVLFNAADTFTKLMTLQATGGTLTADQRTILATQGGAVSRTLSSLLSGTSTLTADQRSILLATQGTINRTVKQAVETTETVLISRSIDDKLSGLLTSLNYSVNQQLAYLHNLADVRTYLFHMRELARGQQGGFRVTTLNASGGVNGAFANSGGSLINWGRMDNFGGLEAGGWVRGAYVNGGFVGNGTWNKDSVLAAYAGGGNIALAGGEFVMNARASAMYASELPAMNDMSWEPPQMGSPEVVMELRQVKTLLSTLVRGQQGQTQLIAASGDRNLEGHKATAEALVEAGAALRLERAKPK